MPDQAQFSGGRRCAAGVEESLGRRDRQSLSDQLGPGHRDGDLGDGLLVMLPPFFNEAVDGIGRRQYDRFGRRCRGGDLTNGLQDERIGGRSVGDGV